MNATQFDVIIIGAGAAGFAASKRAHELGASTLMVDDNALGFGGTCTNVGCMPTKRLLHVGEVLSRIRKPDIKGVYSSLSFDFTTIMEENETMVERLRKKHSDKIFYDMPLLQFITGTAEFVSDTDISVDGTLYSAEKFIVATGSSPAIPPIKGIDAVRYLTNGEALQLKQQPQSLIVIGGGPLGIEFAQIFSRLGTQVCVLHHGEHILSREDPELCDLLSTSLQNEGIAIYTKVQIARIHDNGNKMVVTTLFEGKERTFEGDEVLIATGRRPNTSTFGLERVGVRLGSRGEIVVDEGMRAAAHVWAAGDVTGEPMLRSIAAKEGVIAATNALSRGSTMKMDYRVIPHAVFADPQLASVGLTFAEAVKMGIKCSCKILPMEKVPKTELTDDRRGAIKVIIDVNSREILGVHILAAGGADLIHEGVMAVENRMTVNAVIDTLHVYPTLSEALKMAAQSL
ncbi:MAG: mercury(II) reductase [Halobacteriota archaeon]